MSDLQPFQEDQVMTLFKVSPSHSESKLALRLHPVQVWPQWLSKGGGTGKGHTGHLPITVTSGREQVLMPSVPVVTDQLEHGEKSCALHFSIGVFP